jgi:serine/threonine protein kinase
MADLDPGSEFAGHRIEDVIGRGGMGVVYRAIDLNLEREVAVKVIAPQLAGDEDFRARFRREWRLAASIRHPHVVTIYRAGDENGRLYVSMDYIRGTDLRAMIDTHGPLSPRQATGIVEQVAGALDAAHAAGLVHRDIKPANVLIAQRDGFLDAYLTDFGLSKQLRSGTTALTRTGMFVGTVDYVAPEQLRGDPIDARADIYSLGCVLYEALTGDIPFPRDSEPAKMWAHVSDPPPSARVLRPDLPAELDAVLQRAMAKSPDDRFPSAGDLARAAVAAAAGRALPAAERSVATGDAAPDTTVSPPRQPAESPTAPQGPSPTFVPAPVPPPPAPPPPAAAAVPPAPPGSPPAAPSPAPPGAPPPSSRANRRNLLIVGVSAVGIVALAAVVLAVAGAFGGAGGKKPAPAPSRPKPKPTADLAAGYNATIDTGGTLGLRLSPSRTDLVHLAIKMPLSCADGTDDTFRTSFLSSTDTEHIEGDGSFSFNGTANADEFITGGKITVSGRLQPDGTGAGTARMVEDSRKHGRCDSSIGHWTASGS